MNNVGGDTILLAFSFKPYFVVVFFFFLFCLFVFAFFVFLLVCSLHQLYSIFTCSTESDCFNYVIFTFITEESVCFQLYGIFTFSAESDYL